MQSLLPGSERHLLLVSLTKALYNLLCLTNKLSARPPWVLQGGNFILRKRTSLLEIKYFCKLKELPWAESSPNSVSLFVGSCDKHVRGDSLIFVLNLIAPRPKFTRTRSPWDETLIHLLLWEQNVLR